MKFRHSRSDAYKVDFISDKPSLTQQCFGYDTDINNIVKGCVSQEFISRGVPNWNGVFKPGQFEESMQLVAKAKSMFEELPSNIRKRFDNNPEKLIAFVSDDKNYEEGLKLGLFEKKPLVQPIKVEISNPDYTAVTGSPVTPPEGQT